MTTSVSSANGIADFATRFENFGADEHSSRLRRAVAVGSAETIQRTQAALNRPVSDFHLVAAYAFDHYATQGELLAEVCSFCHAHFVDALLLCGSDAHLTEACVTLGKREDLDVHTWSECEQDNEKPSSLPSIRCAPISSLHVRKHRRAAKAFKRALDLLVACLIALALLPFLLTLAVLIFIDSPGPVLYRSQRIGRRGSTFVCYKFRTMIRDAEAMKEQLRHLNEREGALFKMKNDPRVTRLGRILRRYSLDEFPQLLNVLKGDMSLVGPRPPLASEVAQYEPSQRQRLKVTPGITGLWQVEARTDPSFDRYMELDIRYVRDWSLLLDLQILFRTVGVLLAGTGQ